MHMQVETRNSGTKLCLPFFIFQSTACLMTLRHNTGFYSSGHSQSERLCEHRSLKHQLF